MLGLMDEDEPDLDDDVGVNDDGEDEDEASAEEVRELVALREPPTGAKPLPPPRTSLQELPLGDLEWTDFEKLCERLVALEGEPQRVARYGAGGQAQAGIDIYSRLAGGRGYVAYQCKRHQTVSASTIRNAVNEFLKHKWSRRVRRFVFCTSHTLVPTALADEIEKQSRRLGKRARPIELGTWGLEELSRKLKSHPALVEEFFGPPFPELFSPGGSGRAVDEAVSRTAAEFTAAIQGALQSLQPRVVVATLAWAPEALKDLLQGLAEADEAAFLQLRDLVGDPPQIELVLANIATPASWLGDSSTVVWKALALMAEQKGEWLAASQAWECSADREPDEYQGAGNMVSAAASANVGGDGARYMEMLARARDRHSRHPRLRVEEVRDLPPQQQLDQLAEVELKDPGDIALVCGQQSLASLLLPDLDQAAEFAAKAAEAAPKSVAAQAVALNLTVQRARLNIMDSRSQQAAALQQANRDALTLRDRLLRQRRWEESGRLLMLAVDTLSLQGEFAAARELLVQATADELAAPDNADVLGNAALRTLGPREALILTANAVPTDGVRRIRATATFEGGATAEQRDDALAELDALVRAGGPEASEAAFAQLVDALDYGAWSGAAEAQLKATGHERPALLLLAFYLGGRHANWEEAFALFDDHVDARWGLAGRFRVAVSWGKHSVMKEAADDLMAIGPAQTLKLECGRVYAHTGGLARAREVLAQVAEDESAPSRVRADAFALLVRIVGPQLGEWGLADELHREWVRVRPGDTRASAFAPTIASRLAAERRT
jgi:hypothetical protein